MWDMVIRLIAQGLAEGSAKQQQLAQMTPELQSEVMGPEPPGALNTMPVTPPGQRGGNLDILSLLGASSGDQDPSNVGTLQSLIQKPKRVDYGQYQY